MKTTLIIGIALTIALIVLMVMSSALLLGILAFVIIGFQAFAGYHYEGKKSLCHAFIGPGLLAAFLIFAKVQPIGFIIGMIWIGSVIYLGYKAEITTF